MNEFKIKGLNEIQLRLKGLAGIVGDASADKAIAKATRTAAAVIARKARARARVLDRPNTPNAIYKNIRTYVMKRPQRFNADVGYRVGVLGGAKRPATAVGEFKGKGKDNPGGDTWYWRFLEFGRGPVSVKKAKILANRVEKKVFGRKVGPAAPRSFMRPAMYEAAPEAFKTFADALDKYITKAIEKAA